MSEARDKLIAALKEIVLPTLRNMGFRGSFPHFRRERDEQLDLLTFQFSRWGGSFVVEIAYCPASIDIGNFATDMRGWPDQPAQAGFYDLPASYHNRAGGLSFADGHSEIKRWLDDHTMPPLVKDGLIPDVIPSPNNKDIIWLQEWCTRKINP